MFCKNSEIRMPKITQIISGQEGLRGVQELISAESIRPLLQRMLQQPNLLKACHLRRAKWKPNRKITAYYDVEVQNLASPRQDCVVRPVTATWTPPGPLHPTLSAEEGALGEEIRQRGLAHPFHQLIRVQPDANLHIQAAPLDPHFPHLARLADPTYIREILPAFTSVEDEWSVTPIRYRPRQRHVLRYDLRAAKAGDGHSTTLFAKLYADNGQQEFCGLLDEVAQRIAHTASGTAVLRPRVHLPEDRVLLYDAVCGEPLSANLGPSDSTNARLLHRNLHQAGAALRALHAMPVGGFSHLPGINMESELSAIQRTCEHIAALLPETDAQINSLLGAATALYLDLPQEEDTFVHGDFKADHVLVGSDRHTLIDFDSCASADPAYDIGKFLADLAWWQSDFKSAPLTALRHAFLKGYGLSEDHPRLRRARVWEVLIGIKIIAHRVRIFDLRWATRTADGVERVAAHLNEFCSARGGTSCY